jgi:hypothetical protein
MFKSFLAKKLFTASRSFKKYIGVSAMLKPGINFKALGLGVLSVCINI